MDRFLSSWKEIAAFFGRSVRTVQRWEHRFGLPVHRPIRADRNVVFARGGELEAWIRSERVRDDIRTILLLTDDSEMRNLLRDSLENAGCAVFRCTDAERLYEICKRGPAFHLLIVDLPEGEEARKHLLELVGSHNSGAKVLFLGKCDVPPVPARMAGGMLLSAVLSEPFELSEVHNSIDRLFAEDKDDLNGLLSGFARKPGILTPRFLAHEDSLDPGGISEPSPSVGPG